jgi:hypothetical protein
MTKGEIVGHIVIHVLSLMSTVIVSRATRLISGRKRNRQKNITLRLKKFVIIVDHDRINNVPMIKAQEG